MPKPGLLSVSGPVILIVEAFRVDGMVAKMLAFRVLTLSVEIVAIPLTSRLVVLILLVLMVVVLTVEALTVLMAIALSAKVNLAMRSLTPNPPEMLKFELTVIKRPGVIG